MGADLRNRYRIPKRPSVENRATVFKSLCYQEGATNFGYKEACIDKEECINYLASDPRNMHRSLDHRYAGNKIHSAFSSCNQYFMRR